MVRSPRYHLGTPGETAPGAEGGGVTSAIRLSATLHGAHPAFGVAHGGEMKGGRPLSGR